jgi:hypothetical protein
MKSLAALTLALCFAPVAQGQLPYIYQPGYAGPVAPYRAVYVPTYYPAYYPTYGGGYGYDGGFYERETAYEIRQLRYSIEDAAWERRWRRR